MKLFRGSTFLDSKEKNQHLKQYYTITLDNNNFFFAKNNIILFEFKETKKYFFKLRSL